MFRSQLRRRVRPFALLLISLSLVSCGAEPAPPDVVATSTIGAVTAGELEGYILSLPPARRQPAEDQKPAAWRREILSEMLVTRRLTDEATEADLLATEEGQAYVKSLWEPVLTARVRDLRVAAEVKVTDEELREFYDTHPEEFGHGPQVRVRHIFKRTTRDATASEREAARREIDALHRQLQEGASFIELARNHSDSETAALEGLIGRLDPGALGPAVDKIVWALEVGEISEVVSTPVGFHIFKVDNRIEPFKMEFAEATTRLRRRFERQETEATLDEYFDELLAASGGSYDPDALNRSDIQRDTVLFTLGDVELTYGQLLDVLFSLPFVEQRAATEREQLEGIITQELYLWEADRLELAAQPEMAAQLEQIESSAGVELAYRNRRKAHLEELDDAVLESYYDENRERFRSPQLLRVRLLVRLFEEEGQGWFEMYEELDRLANSVRAGELDFAAEATRRSQDLSAARGGDSGWIRPGAIGDWAGPRAGKAVLALLLDQISDPILIEFYDSNRLIYERRGYMLVRAEEIRSTGDQPFDEVRDRVAEQFVLSGSESLQRQIAREVLKEIDATIFQDRL
jgi:parvulin-like peptidyl-prolyl isomerase